MSLRTIICVNTATGCNTEVEKQITVTGPSCYIVRIPPSFFKNRTSGADLTIAPGKS